MESIEKHASEQDETFDYSSIMDDLVYLMEHPLNLNTAKREDFQPLIFLNDLQVNDIINKRDRLGGYKNMFQLQLLGSLSYTDIQNLSHFVYPGPVIEEGAGKLKRSLKYGRHDVFIRYERTIEEREGYKSVADSILEQSPNKRYLGNPDKYYLRYSYRSRNIRWGINAEKDPGEEFFSGYQPQGFDFYSGYVMVKDLRWTDKLIIGDFTLQSGQGLALWPGMSFGKSFGATSVRKQSRGLQPSTSMNESGYFRGIAARKKWGPMYFSTFYSRAKRDANVKERDPRGRVTTISSLQQTGYHNTESRIKNKHAVREEIVGASIFARPGNFKLGATAYHFSLNASLVQRKQLYSKFRFSGRERVVAGVDYEYNRRNFIFFGETAWSDNGGWGSINGFIFRPAGGIFLSVLHRFFGRDYQNIKGSAFGENSKNQNEKGLYAAIKAQFNKQLSLNAYADHFQFDWLSYRVDAPSRGSEYRLRMDYEPSSGDWNMYLKYRYEQKMQNPTDATLKIYQPKKRQKQGLCLAISWNANSWLHFNNRAQWTGIQMQGEKPEDGWLVYQDILLRPAKKPLAVSFRYALFNTVSYNARLYAYEHDVLYAFSIPAYYYQGFRSYLMIKYAITEGIDFWIKIARSTYMDRETTGSGLNQIDEPHKTDLKVQLRIKF
ncbi:MAG: hypothetical protein R6U19_08805 [Bacteroidales bacterium]